MNSKFDFTKPYKYAFSASIGIILIGIILLVTIGFNLGIDFTGGTVLTVGVKTTEEVTIDDALADARLKIADVLAQNNITIYIFQTVETDNSKIVSVRYQDVAGLNDHEMNDLNDLVLSALLAEFDYTSEEDIALIVPAARIGATASRELVLNAFTAVLVATVLILLYVAFRFEVSMGLASIIGLFHDLLMVCSLVIIFRIPINSAFIAALITIVGYSVNAIIIIFDRIRENLKKEAFENAPRELLVNHSIKQTFARTIYTTGTTLTAIILLAIFGGSSIQEFSLPIIFGLLSGMYSSLFIVGPFWMLENRESPKHISKKQQQKLEA